METSPMLNSSIRSILIAAGTVGVTKGWWDQTGLEGLVDHLIAFGSAAVAIGAFAWGIWAKRPQTTEAQNVAKNVLASGGPSK